MRGRARDKDKAGNAWNGGVSARECARKWRATHERRWPGSHESSLLYWSREASEWRAAAGPDWSLYVWFGNVPTSHELYLRARTLETNGEASE